MGVGEVQVRHIRLLLSTHPALIPFVDPFCYTNCMSEVSLHIIVKPKSPRAGVWRTTEGVLVRVTAAPVEGAANDAVIKALAAALAVPKSHLAIIGGAGARLKKVAVDGLTGEELAAKVAALPELN